jgi:hypothetical protein
MHKHKNAQTGVKFLFICADVKVKGTVAWIWVPNQIEPTYLDFKDTP